MPDGLNIIFMGTPEYAVPCLEALAPAGHTVSLVVTQPDRPKGRGRKLSPPPVKQAAQKLNYPVIQPDSIKTEAFERQIIEARPDVLVVVAYGHFLPENILSIPRLGAVNIHPSLLPAYRGPSPIQWAIVKMEQETGVTSIFMDAHMDSGDIIAVKKETIHPEDTAADLHDRLAVIGAEVLVETLRQIKDGTARPAPQDRDRVSIAPLLKKKDGLIDWNQPAAQIDAFVRGMTPWPGAYTFLDGKRYKILSAQVIKDGGGKTAETAPPGTVLKSFSGELRVAAAEGAVSILTIQGESGKALDISEYLRGRSIPEGAVFA